MLVLETATLAKADSKGLESSEGKGGVNLSGSMTRQVYCYMPRTHLSILGLTVVIG